MSDRRTQFYLDKHNGKWLGVCAGIADYTGLDVTLVRVGMVLLTLATSGWAFLGYIAAAWFAPKKPIEHYTSRSEEHTSELQSLMRISYAVFCLKKKKQTQEHNQKRNT